MRYLILLRGSGHLRWLVDFYQAARLCFGAEIHAILLMEMIDAFRLALIMFGFEILLIYLLRWDTVNTATGSGFWILIRNLTLGRLWLIHT